MASFNKKNIKLGPNQNDGPSTASSPDSANLSNNSTQGNNNNAPKYGTLVPNRVFVGGISSTTTESELCQLFSKYGNVKDTKIIADRAGVSKGYGFVTFESEEEAKLLQRDADNIILKERKLNIAPAIKKQPFNRAFETTSSPPPPVPANLFFPNGVSYTYHNGMAFFGPSAQQPVPPIAPAPAAEPAQIFQGYGPTQNPPAPFAPVMFSCNPQPLYIPAQQFHPYQPMPINNGGTTTAYLYNGGGPPSSDRNSPMATSESSSTHMSSLPPPPQFYPTQFQPNEMCYSIPQAVYPLFTVNTLDSTVYTSAGCEVTDPPSSNISAEVSPQFQSRQYYNPGYQFQNPQAHTTPLNPKRYNNPGKKQTGNSNGASNGNFGRSKYRNAQCSTNAVDKSALGGAGDAPPLGHNIELTPPYTPVSSSSTISATAAQTADTITNDLNTKVQGLSL